MSAHICDIAAHQKMDTPVLITVTASRLRFAVAHCILTCCDHKWTRKKHSRKKTVEATRRNNSYEDNSSAAFAITFMELYTKTLRWWNLAWLLAEDIITVVDILQQLRNKVLGVLVTNLVLATKAQHKAIG